MLMTSRAALSFFEVANELFLKQFDQREFAFPGPHVSVSLNINFHDKDPLLADVYRANSWLRRMGLRPTPPRQSVLLDRFKATWSSSACSLATAGRPRGGRS